MNFFLWLALGTSTLSSLSAEQGVRSVFTIHFNNIPGVKLYCNKKRIVTGTSPQTYIIPNQIEGKTYRIVFQAQYPPPNSRWVEIDTTYVGGKEYVVTLKNSVDSNTAVPPSRARIHIKFSPGAKAFLLDGVDMSYLIENDSPNFFTQRLEKGIYEHTLEVIYPNSRFSKRVSFEAGEEVQVDLRIKHNRSPTNRPKPAPYTRPKPAPYTLPQLNFPKPIRR